MSKESLHIVYLGIGSNLGDRYDNIVKAVKKLTEIGKTIVTKISPIYETAPIGPPQGNYLNGVIQLLTALSPQDLLTKLRKIEKELGRLTKGDNMPRTIDLDILLYDDIILNDKDLTIPHPRMYEREFVMRPLNDIRE